MCYIKEIREKEMGFYKVGFFSPPPLFSSVLVKKLQLPSSSLLWYCASTDFFAVSQATAKAVKQLPLYQFHRKNNDIRKKVEMMKVFEEKQESQRAELRPFVQKNIMLSSGGIISLSCLKNNSCFYIVQQTKRGLLEDS